jgi:integrase
MSKREFGTVRQLPSGRFQARYRDGLGQMLSAPITFKTKGDASRWLSGHETDLARGTALDPQAGKMSVAAWAEDWMTTKRGQRRNTLAKNRAALSYALPVIGGTPVSAVTPLQIRQVVKAMQDAGLEASSVIGYLTTVSSLFAAAVEADLIARSPVRRKILGLKETTRRDREHLPPPELVRLADAVPESFATLVLTGGVLGLRWSEAIALRPASIEFLTRKLTVDRTIEEVAGHLEAIEQTKSAAGRRTIAVPAFLIDAIAEHLAIHRAGIDSGDLVWVSSRGGVLRRNFLSRVLRPAQRRVEFLDRVAAGEAVDRVHLELFGKKPTPARTKALRSAVADGIDARSLQKLIPASAGQEPSDLTFHGLRHVAATYLEEIDAPLRVRQHRLGHAPQGITLGVYTHVPDELDRAVADRLHEHFLTRCGTDVARRRESEAS